jgi:diamine N-acetyltransferase
MGTKFIVESGEQPIGWVLTTDDNVEHGVTRAHTALQEDNVGHGVGVVATALLVEHLFRHLPFRKIYFEVPGYNANVVRIWRKIGLAEEGVLKGDRYWDGSYWDLHIFALYREAWPDIRARVLRPERSNLGTPCHDPGANGSASTIPKVG